MNSQRARSDAFNIYRILLSIPTGFLGFLSLLLIALGIGAIPVDPERNATKAEKDRWLYWPDLALGLPLLLITAAGFIWAYGPGKRQRFSRLIGLIPSNLVALALIIGGQRHLY